MANLNVCRNGGLGDIINLLYFCNYYKKSGHNINFVCGEKFYDFIKLQKVTNTVNDKLLKNNYFNLTFDGREHSDLKQINNNVFDIFYRHGNNLIKTEPLYFEIKTDKECDEKVLNLYKNLKRPIVCVYSFASSVNRSFNINDIKKLLGNKINGTFVNISHYIEFENHVNAFEKLPKTLTMLHLLLNIVIYFLHLIPVLYILEIIFLNPLLHLILVGPLMNTMFLKIQIYIYYLLVLIALIVNCT